MTKEKDNIDQLFSNLEGTFDVYFPNDNHEDRFLAKLNAVKAPVKDSKTKTYWKPLLAIAASLLICFALFNGLNQNSETLDLASVSPELSETQDFFTVTIAEELNKLDAERSPLTENIIYDAMRQLKILETDYNTLKSDLNESGNDKRVIYAMISNFQNRIELLTEVLEKIEDLKDLKATQNEIENTL